jgi:hypothetical protein
MTKDDIDKLWHQAMSDSIKNGEDFTRHRFAHLVAAAEREECAKVCEDASTPPAGEMLTDGQWASKILAGKIRARGTT